MEKELPKRLRTARNPENAKSRKGNTNCQDCSRQRSQFKKKFAHQEREDLRLQALDEDYEPKYRDDAFKSKFQSLKVEKEALQSNLELSKVNMSASQITCKIEKKFKDAGGSLSSGSIRRVIPDHPDHLDHQDYTIKKLQMFWQLNKDELLPLYKKSSIMWDSILSSILSSEEDKTKRKFRPLRLLRVIDCDQDLVIFDIYHEYELPKNFPTLNEVSSKIEKDDTDYYLLLNTTDIKKIEKYYEEQVPETEKTTIQAKIPNTLDHKIFLGCPIAHYANISDTNKTSFIELEKECLDYAYGYSCDNCNKDISKLGYHCEECNYDLCETEECKVKIQDHEHPMHQVFEYFCCNTYDMNNCLGAIEISLDDI